jgi:hypothetical protein
MLGLDLIPSSSATVPNAWVQWVTEAVLQLNPGVEDVVGPNVPLPVDQRQLMAGRTRPGAQSAPIGVNHDSLASTVAGARATGISPKFAPVHR